MDIETTDVIICGCGPTGALLSAHLGQQSVKNIVLEKELEITQDPRGIALDEDGIRLLQGIGIYDKIFTDIGQPMGIFNFISSATDLHVAPFLKFDYNTIEGGTGHPGFMCHKQPVLERNIRDVIARCPGSEIRSGSTVQAISEDDDYVYVSYADSAGNSHSIRAKFFVGADGKTGFTRKKYLEPKGISMEKDTKFKYEAAWVALNWKITPPTPKSHPDFPLWKLGYTPEEVYDAFFPRNFRFICNPDRPSVCGRFGLPTDRLWRFEFVVKEGEDGYEMAKYESVKKVIYPYLTHPKERYNLTEDLAFPENCIDVIRSRPFTFSARSCNKWALGRVILCGDAAHVFPPFGGQGIASGFRDASSLAWRLAVACRPGFRGHEKLLEGWYMERKQQLEKSLAATIVNGNFCNENNAVKIYFRNLYLWALQLVPSWRHQLELGQRQEGMTRYTWAQGMPFLPDLQGGKAFPQVFCSRYNAPEGTRPEFTDDIIFSKEKKALFQLVALLPSAKEISTAVEDLANFSEQFEGELRVREATYIIDDAKTDSNDSLAQKMALDGTYRIFYTNGKDQESQPGLPPLTRYDGARMRKDIKGKYIIVRPDRFVFAACNSTEELVRASRALVEFISTQ